MGEFPLALQIIIYVIAFFVGASVFSFLEVIIIRVPQKRSFVSGRSVCDSCGHELSALDMIPVFGWLLLGGRCRYCKAKFPPTSSVKEAAGGAICCLCILRWGLAPVAFAGFICVCALNVSAFIAMTQKKVHIPSAVTAGALVFITVAAAIITSDEKVKCAVFAAVIVVASFVAAMIAWFIKRALNKENDPAYVAWFIMCVTLAAGIFILK